MLRWAPPAGTRVATGGGGGGGGGYEQRSEIEDGREDVEHSVSTAASLVTILVPALQSYTL